MRLTTLNALQRIRAHGRITKPWVFCPFKLLNARDPDLCWSAANFAIVTLMEDTNATDAFYVYKVIYVWIKRMNRRAKWKGARSANATTPFSSFLWWRGTQHIELHWFAMHWFLLLSPFLLSGHLYQFLVTEAAMESVLCPAGKWQLVCDAATTLGVGEKQFKREAANGNLRIYRENGRKAHVAAPYDYHWFYYVSNENTNANSEKTLTLKSISKKQTQETVEDGNERSKKTKSK